MQLGPVVVLDERLVASADDLLDALWRDPEQSLRRRGELANVECAGVCQIVVRLRAPDRRQALEALLQAGYGPPVGLLNSLPTRSAMAAWM